MDKRLVISAALASAAFTSTQVSASDYGCTALLCFAAGNPMSIAECRPTVKRVLRDLWKGRGFPTCGLVSYSGNTQYKAETRLSRDPYKICPEGFREVTHQRKHWVYNGTQTPAKTSRWNDDYSPSDFGNYVRGYTDPDDDSDDDDWGNKSYCVKGSVIKERRVDVGEDDIDYRYLKYYSEAKSRQLDDTRRRIDIKIHGKNHAFKY